MNTKVTTDNNDRLVEGFAVLGIGDEPVAAQPLGLEGVDDVASVSVAATPEQQLAQQLTHLRLQPQVIDKYPFIEYEDPVCDVDGLLPFAFPTGCSVLGSARGLAQIPTAFTFFAHTLGLYGHVFIFWEPISEPVQQHLRALVQKQATGLPCTAATASGSAPVSPGADSVAASSDEAPVPFPVAAQAPKAFLLLSRWNFPAFRTALREIYRLSLSPQRTPLEAIITNLCCEVVLPPCGMVDVKYNIGAEELTFARAPANDRTSPRDLHLRELAEVISGGTWRTAVFALLAERSVILQSSSLTLLGWAAEALVACLYPFKWTAAYVPVLPAEGLTMLQAPFPFIAGVHSSLWPAVDESCLPHGAVIVHLDSDSVDVPAEAPLPPLPPHQAGKLNKHLASTVDVIHAARREQWAIEQLPVYDSAFTMIPPRDLDDDEEAQRVAAAAEVSEAEIREVFFKFNVALLMEHRRFFEVDAVTGQPMPDGDGPAFRSADFIKSMPSDHAPLLKVLLGTQAWSGFVQERTHPDRTAAVDTLFLNESISAKSNRYALAKWKGKQKETPFLETHDFQVQRTVGSMRPDTSELPKWRQYTYSPLPPLNAHLFPTPRQVNTLTDDTTGLTLVLERFVTENAVAQSLSDAVERLGKKAKETTARQLEAFMDQLRAKHPDMPRADGSDGKGSTRRSLFGMRVKSESAATRAGDSKKRSGSIWAGNWGGMFGGGGDSPPPDSPIAPARGAVKSSGGALGGTAAEGSSTPGSGMLRSARGHTVTGAPGSSRGGPAWQSDVRKANLVHASRGHVDTGSATVRGVLASTVYAAWFVAYASAVRAGVGHGLACSLAGGGEGQEEGGAKHKRVLSTPTSERSPSGPRHHRRGSMGRGSAALRADAAATLQVASGVFESLLAMQAGSDHVVLDTLVFRAMLDVAGRCGDLKAAFRVASAMVKAGLPLADAEKTSLRRAAEMDPMAGAAIPPDNIKQLVSDVVASATSKSLGFMAFGSATAVASGGDVSAEMEENGGSGMRTPPPPPERAASSPPAPPSQQQHAHSAAGAGGAGASASSSHAATVASTVASPSAVQAYSAALKSPYGLLSNAFPDLKLNPDADTCPEQHKLTYDDIANGWQADRNQYTTVCTACIDAAWQALLAKDQRVILPKRFVPHLSVSCSAKWWGEAQAGSSAAGAAGASPTAQTDKAYWCYLLPPWALLKEELAVLQGGAGGGSAGMHPFTTLRQDKPMLFWNMLLQFSRAGLPCDFLVAAAASTRDRYLPRLDSSLSAVAANALALEVQAEDSHESDGSDDDTSDDEGGSTAGNGRADGAVVQVHSSDTHAADGSQHDDKQRNRGGSASSTDPQGTAPGASADSATGLDAVAAAAAADSGDPGTPEAVAGQPRFEDIPPLSLDRVQSMISRRGGMHSRRLSGVLLTPSPAAASRQPPAGAAADELFASPTMRRAARMPSKAQAGEPAPTQ